MDQTQRAWIEAHPYNTFLDWKLDELRDEAVVAFSNVVRHDEALHQEGYVLYYMGGKIVAWWDTAQCRGYKSR